MTREGGDLVVHSQGRPRPGAVEPGEYRVVHGEDTGSATLPRTAYLRLFAGGTAGPDDDWVCEHLGQNPPR